MNAQCPGMFTETDEFARNDECPYLKQLQRIADNIYIIFFEDIMIQGEGDDAFVNYHQDPDLISDIVGKEIFNKIDKQLLESNSKMMLLSSNSFLPATIQIIKEQCKNDCIAIIMQGE